MENASKALIIAGAILLSILIIGLGMYIYNQAASVMDDTGLKSQEVQSYNEQFERYEGTTVKGATVKAMIDTVRNHNNSTRQDTSKMVQINWDSEEIDNIDATTFPDDEDPNEEPGYPELKGNIKNGAQYRVQCGHDPNTGLVTSISISEQQAGG